MISTRRDTAKGLARVAADACLRPPPSRPESSSVCAGAGRVGTPSLESHARARVLRPPAALTLTLPLALLPQHHPAQHPPSGSASHTSLAARRSLARSLGRGSERCQRLRGAGPLASGRCWKLGSGPQLVLLPARRRMSLPRAADIPAGGQPARACQKRISGVLRPPLSGTGTFMFTARSVSWTGVDMPRK